MPVKTLKIKRVFAWALYSNLRNTAPKDYPTTEEIKNTINEVLPSLKPHVEVYAEMIKKAQEVNGEMVGKSEEEVKSVYQPKIDKLNDEWKKYNHETGPEVVEIQLEGSAFKTLNDQFNRDGWGKKWIATIEEFGEILKAFEEASK